MSSCATCAYWGVTSEQRARADMAICRHLGAYDARTAFDYRCPLYVAVEPVAPARSANPGPGQPVDLRTILPVSDCRICGVRCGATAVLFGRRQFCCPTCGTTWSEAV